MAVCFAVAAICLLLWQLWRAQQLYALELADQERLVEVEQEKTALAQHERETVARESQAKSEMIATLSNEIRNHLNGIIGSADLLLDSAPRPQQREHLSTLRSSAEALHQALNDVMEYSRIETAQIQIARTQFDLRQPAIEAVEQLSPVALLKGLELVLIVGPDVPVLVTGDALRLRQVLLNLMSNAVKFTASGRVVLRVQLDPNPTNLQKEGVTGLHFSVSDTGPGIPAEMQATIFDRFAPSNSNSPRKFGGSGLELAICKRLVELMGGQIGARSLPEVGSEFWVTLALPAMSAPVENRALIRHHVVVLGDLAAARVAVSAMLTRLGVDHDATDTVLKAVELLRDTIEASSHDLTLLIDEVIARDRGAELAQLLAADPELSRVRVVMMTRDPDRAAPEDYGLMFAAVLRKPLLRSEVLLEALRSSKALPVPRPAGTRVPFAASAETKPASPAGSLVLVVDDDEISRSVSSQLLAILGCRVERAVSGPEAIERAAKTHFDLIFMDCQMPEMDGFATTSKIRDAVGPKAPPIVALTANISDADREKCFAVGMCDFVGKPVNRSELARVLTRWTKPAAGSAN
jgi:signal transduction histidine kinase/DNA-binding response OmpR family regulator